MQPHKPYISQYLETGEPLSDAEYNGYKALKRGDISQEKNWQLYLDNLRSVLDEVELLLENVDAERVVITADHGEAFGEWGAFGHPEGFPAPVVKQVPWVETTAVDDGDYSPTIESRDTEPDADVKEHLADMGYL